MSLWVGTVKARLFASKSSGKSVKGVYTMATSELDSLVARFERLSQNPQQHKRARQSLALDIDAFLAGFSVSRTPRHRLVAAQRALSKCSLPLTKFIFAQEADLMGRVFEDGGLALSPEVSISVVSGKRNMRSISTQCDLIDGDLPKRLAGRMVQSLEEIRGDVSQMAEGHAKRKQKRKLAIELIRSSYEHVPASPL
jgi:hypothetical protein